MTAARWAIGAIARAGYVVFLLVSIIISSRLYSDERRGGSLLNAPAILFRLRHHDLGRCRVHMAILFLVRAGAESGLVEGMYRECGDQGTNGICDVAHLGDECAVEGAGSLWMKVILEVILTMFSDCQCSPSHVASAALESVAAIHTIKGGRVAVYNKMTDFGKLVQDPAELVRKWQTTVIG